MRRAPVIFCGGKRMKKELIFCFLTEREIVFI